MLVLFEISRDNYDYLLWAWYKYNAKGFYHESL
jgi:hypothetical protein